MKRFAATAGRQKPSGSSHRKAHLRPALTLVELLAATILAALLMAAVLGVLKSVTRSQKALLRGGRPEAWQARLIAQLEWDLANSRTAVTTPDGFQLVGFAGRDFASGAILHGPTAIQYSVQTVGSQSCLFRSEAHLDSLNLDNQSRELVCNRIVRIALGSADATAVKGSSATSAPAQNSEDTPIPDQPVVVLYGVGQETPVLQHAFTLR